MTYNTKKAMRVTDQSTHIAKESVFDKQIQTTFNTKDDDLSTVWGEKILSLIGAGEENAIHLCDLIHITGLGNREIRKCIETLRSYEVDRYVRQETGRAKSIFYTLKAARKWQSENINP
ncbi:MAG TPA: hypothetical protein DEP65_06775 [Ruminococcus sp.]|nr:hypothetical protein [Ruminococcus sp.]